MMPMDAVSFSAARISVGASFYPANNNDSFEALYTRADEGAYESKRKEGSLVTFRLVDK